MSEVLEPEIVKRVSYFCYDYGWVCASDKGWNYEPVKKIWDELTELGGGENISFEGEICLGSLIVEDLLKDLREGKKLSEVVDKNFVFSSRGVEFRLRSAKFMVGYEEEYKGKVLKSELEQVGKLLIPSYSVLESKYFIQKGKSKEWRTLDLEKVLVLGEEQIC